MADSVFLPDGTSAAVFRNAEAALFEREAVERHCQESLTHDLEGRVWELEDQAEFHKDRFRDLGKLLEEALELRDALWPDRDLLRDVLREAREMVDNKMESERRTLWQNAVRTRKSL